jgi:hypothetical protein
MPGKNNLSSQENFLEEKLANVIHNSLAAFLSPSNFCRFWEKPQSSLCKNFAYIFFRQYIFRDIFQNTKMGDLRKGMANTLKTAKKCKINYIYFSCSPIFLAETV